VQPISSALARAAEADQRERHADQAPKSALVLLVDQLAVNFTDTKGSFVSEFTSIVFGACKVLDLASIFVEDVKAFCLT
jgi:hypothetical protein